jgi:hypothetical protein
MFPSVTWTRTDPAPAMKKRSVGSLASRQIVGELAEPPAGSDSEEFPSVPVAA